ncbi:predicted protein [Paecilomyces variotii No. 5]|uniref:DUF6536 domain-containing protein n=1 Tax=Byssochlamys spectabilis (strain No. 5 / NBRC 109023) TaxID=1356009 RepID=V5FJ15_BYSSN|nr:predicted protein [Paecilomyces variotii No. 5]
MDEALLPTARKKRRSGFWPFERDAYDRLGNSRDGINLETLSPQSGGGSGISSSTRLVHETTTPVSPEVSTDDKPTPRLIHLINAGRGLQTSHERAWAKGVLMCACATSVVLFINIILTIVATAIAYSRYKNQDFSAPVLYQGKCSETKGWASGIHLVINVLSTLVLGASNYCMQCLGSPSREDVDRAHAQRTWLDIGTPSIGNFNFVGRRRFVLWSALLLTSLPIHLMWVLLFVVAEETDNKISYNSAVFSAVATNEYGVVAVPSDFDLNHPGNYTKEYINCFEPSLGMNMSEFYSDLSQQSFETLNKQECVDIFAADYLGGRGTLVVVTSDKSIGNQSLHWVGKGNSLEDSMDASYAFDSFDPYAWMCRSLPGQPSPCNKDAVQKYIDSWSVDIDDWTYPKLLATVDGPQGPTNISGSTQYLPSDVCRYGWDESPFCKDVDTLQRMLTVYPSEAGLRLELDDAKAWVNATWARRVNITQTGQQCASAIETVSGYTTFNKVSVDHCLSQKIEEDCQLLFSLPICIAVILCNLTKIACMFLTAQDDRKEIFLTVGDAISSFLTRPDPTTKGRCLLSTNNITKGRRPWRNPLSAKMENTPRTYPAPSNIPDMLPSRKRWVHAATIWRWVVTIALCIVLISITGGLLSTGINNVKSYGSSVSIPALWKLGFGTATSTTLITLFQGTGFGSSFIGMILLANVPQLLVSTAYFLYNGLLTHMLLAAEYDDYAMVRKPLRVSWPKGQQRSSYYLSLPYRYSIPLLIVSAILHWLVSESIFYVEILPFDMTGKLWYESRLVTCGYSPIAIILAIALGCLMVLAILGIGLRDYKSNMPLVHGCSAAISAACHPLMEDDEHALKPIMWGEIPLRRSSKAVLEDQLLSPDPAASLTSSLPSRHKDYKRITTSERFADVVDESDAVGKDLDHWNTVDLDDGHYGHCSFTSGDVIPPDPVKLYV